MKYHKTLARLLGLLVLAGCTTQAWYEGLRENERQRCRGLPDPQEAQRCLREVEQRTYEDYRRERESAGQ